MAGSRRVKIPRKARKARSGKYKFSDKRHPVSGIVSFVMGIAAFFLALTGIILSEKAKGQGTLMVGVLGTVSMAVSAIGFVLGFSAFKQKEIHYRFPVMGGVMNGALLVFLLFLYILGATV